MTDILLVLTNPYAYENALAVAVNKAQQAQVELKVVFLISSDSVSDMMGDLAERGWFGMSSLRTLQNKMIEGYRALAGDVLKRVCRKAAPIEPILEGVVEKHSLVEYLQSRLRQGDSQIIVSSAELPNPEWGNWLGSVDWIKEG